MRPCWYLSHRVQKISSILHPSGGLLNPGNIQSRLLPSPRPVSGSVIVFLKLWDVIGSEKKLVQEDLPSRTSWMDSTPFVKYQEEWALSNGRYLRGPGRGKSGSVVCLQRHVCPRVSCVDGPWVCAKSCASHVQLFVTP